MVQKGKPDPEVFLLAAQKLNAVSRECLVFEDAFHGIKAAHAAGMKVVALTTTYPADKLMDADRIIKDFTEISFAAIQALLE
jgi:beta-phosphoglucomutase-like phosphatase (HAD superfamily)